MPEISVIMSVYKEPLDWIKQSVDSILNQTFRDFEFIIIDDNPEDEKLYQFLLGVADSDCRIRLLKNEENIGLTKSLNIGLSKAEGKYIARMDADDISLPERFQIQYDYMESHIEIGVSGCNVKTFGLCEERWCYPENHEDFQLYYESPFAHPTVIIRKYVLLDNNIGYDENYRYAQDYDLWERLYYVTKFSNIQTVLLKYRLSKVQITGNPKQFKNSTQIKLRAFNKFCAYNHLDFCICSPIGLNTIRAYKLKACSLVIKPNIFLSYIYRSLNEDRVKALFYLFLSLDFLKFGLVVSAKVIFTLVFPNKMIPLLNFENEK